MVAALITAGCTAQARDPTGLGAGGTGPVDTGGGGAGGGGGTGGGVPIPAPLLGRWENTLLLQTVGDLVTVTTTWEFRPDGSCLRTVRSFSVIEGVPRTTVRGCRFLVLNASLAITFDDGGTATFSFGFAAQSPSRLLLGGLEFARVA